MQIGGLGLMTMSLAVISFFMEFGLYTQVLASEILSIKNFQDSKKILIFIIKLTAICELLGALITFYIIKNDFPFHRAIFVSLFHAVSCFCNVGLSLFKNGNLAYNNNYLMLTTTTLLMLFGSLGFVTFHELLKKIQGSKNNHYRKISWHTMLVLKVFFATALITLILLWLLERNNTLSLMTPMQTFFNLILLSISTKSVGYITIPINCLQPATILLLAIVAFIGSAPSSTGGGIKTSVFAVFLAIIKATLSGRSHAEIHGRTISKEQVYKAMAIISLSGLWIICVIFCLLITEINNNFIDIFLEVISGFSNNGISTGITSSLTIFGKFIMSITMIIGRIGALALIIGMQRSFNVIEFSYPEEKIILG